MSFVPGKPGMCPSRSDSFRIAKRNETKGILRHCDAISLSPLAQLRARSADAVIQQSPAPTLLKHAEVSKKTRSSEPRCGLQDDVSAGVEGNDHGFSMKKGRMIRQAVRVSHRRESGRAATSRADVARTAPICDTCVAVEESGTRNSWLGPVWVRVSEVFWR